MKKPTKKRPSKRVKAANGKRHGEMNKRQRARLAATAADIDVDLSPSVEEEPEQQQFEARDHCLVDGLHDEDRDERLIRVAVGNQTGVVPLSAFADGGRSAKRLLAEQGVTIIAETTWKAIIARVDDHKAFVPRSIIRACGLGNRSFTWPTGEQTTVSVEDNGIVAFGTNAVNIHRSGTLEGWQARVANACIGHPLLSFALMLPFAAPLLKVLRLRSAGVVFEGPWSATSLLVRAATSTVGCPGTMASRRYSTAGLAALSEPDAIIAAHRHMPLIIDQLSADQPGLSTKAAAEAAKALVLKWRAAGDDGLSYFVSAVASVGEDAIKETIPSTVAIVPVAIERPLGAFDLTEWAGDAAELTRSLVAATDDEHGWAMHAFIKGLVAYRNTNAEKLKRFALFYLERFRDDMGVDHDDVDGGTFADIFGIVQVAGILAKHLHVLPVGFRPVESAAECYRLAKEARQANMPLLDKLRLIAGQPGAIDVTRKVDLSLAELKAASLLVRTDASGDREVLLFGKALDRLVANRLAAINELTAAGALDRDNDNPAKKVTLAGKLALGRVYVVRIGRHDASTIGSRVALTPPRTGLRRGDKVQAVGPRAGKRRQATIHKLTPTGAYVEWSDGSGRTKVAYRNVRRSKGS